MALIDAWEAPEPNPYFMTRLNARLNEERQAPPQAGLNASRRASLMDRSCMPARSPPWL